MNYKLTGVRITALCPSFTETPILDTLPGIIAITKGYSVKNWKLLSTYEGLDSMLRITSTYNILIQILNVKYYY